MAQADAEKFLDMVEKNKKLRDQVKALSHVTQLGKEHKLSFTNADLSKALKKKWGSPEHRKQAKSESFTCCCI
jgi:Nif11 domain